MMQGGEQKPVLFATLNWGMGHASRSAPLIRALQDKGVTVIIASDGVAADLLQAEFPGQVIHELPSYTIRYFTRNIYWNVFRNLGTILSAIWAEHRWLRDFVRHQPLSAIISDNRYGIRLSTIPSILITHQFQFYGPLKWANKIGERAVRWWAQKYNEIWVPDWTGSPSLCGEMSNWNHSFPPVYYLGPLSRMVRKIQRLSDPEIDILIILSGPEPQRTELEEEVTKQVENIPGNHLLIRGTLKSRPHYLDNQKVRCFDILPSKELNRLIGRSTMLISRSGYSTVMDLVYSGIPALMIPTPGQIEQEYLASRLNGKGPWLFQTQDELDIRKAWNTRESWSIIRSIRPSGDEATQAVTSFLQRLETNRTG